jgi:F-type H+-transporting ATPase subunit a
MAPFLGLELNPLEHVKDSFLFEGSPGELGAFGRRLGEWGFTKQAFLFCVAGAITLVLLLWMGGRARRDTVPQGFANFLESILVFVRDQMTRPFLGVEGDRYLPVIWTFFIFILIANLLGLVPFFDYLGHGGNTATGSIWLTLALAVCSFFIYHGIGVRRQGFGHYLKNLFPHVPAFVLPIIIPVEIIAHIVRPFALTIRLFANMLAGHTLIAVILGFTMVWTHWIHWGMGVSLVSFVTVVALTFLELLVAVLQAFIFSFLTTVFLAGAVHPEH